VNNLSGEELTLMNIYTLQHLSLIKISGDDAEAFLQGQFSNDVTQLDQCWQLSAYCNPKGRMLAMFYLWRYQGDFYALFSKDLNEAIVKRLRMYVMRSKVNIENLDSAMICGIIQDQEFDQSNLTNNDSQLSTLDFSAENGYLHADSDGCILYLKNRAIYIRYSGEDAALQIEEINLIEESVTWENSDISDGIPLINAANSEQFIPQMINLDVLGGVNFQKGCYTGQEIVARMHYLGNLKQRMFLCEFSEPEQSLSQKDEVTESAQVGAKILVDDGSEKSVGSVVNHIPHGKQLLAVLRLDSLGNVLKTQNGEQLKVAAQQPYPLPTPKAK